MRRGATFVLVPLCLGTLLGQALAGSWALPDESRGARVAPLLLLSRPEVRDDLQLSADQALEVEKAIDDLHHKAAALKGKTGEAAIAQRKAVDEGQKLWLEKHLTIDQVDRLWQVDLRWEGPAAIATRHTVAEALSLSDEQRAALSRALLERNAHRDKTKNAPASEQQFSLRVMSVLSEGQRKRWEQMLGRPLAIKTAAASPTAQPGPAR
jgi:hypothetical protein